MLNRLWFSDAYASVNRVINDPGTGLASVRHQAMTWTNADLMISPHPRPGTKLQWNESEIKMQNFSHRKWFSNYSLWNWGNFYQDTIEDLYAGIRVCDK